MVIVVDILKETSSYLIIRLDLPCQEGPTQNSKPYTSCCRNVPYLLGWEWPPWAGECVSSSERH